MGGEIEPDTIFEEVVECLESVEGAPVPSAAADTGYFGPFSGWGGVLSIGGVGEGRPMLAAVADGYVCW